MRLSAIKLSGFKSFVEPTTIRFPTNLMGIVGPNGCGKSNIIDAVRWVMGEISARQLRGESMSDVIFAGSRTRKPVSMATVELLFDNRDGRAGGQYAAYSEIAVKRQVTRDGQSAYFLNGTKCRRKDITDLFLGTGLGPRSYAIIEQGMISQIVEARPEELRGFLEEAAGISRYRERRRETENRIRHTRENLERLADLREEVSKQLDKLKRQARAAERYRKLKNRYRHDEAVVQTLHWRNLAAEIERQGKAGARIESQLQESLAQLTSAEKNLESLHQEQQDANESWSKVQGELYEVAGEIARIEQSIEHQRQLRQRQQAERDEIEEQLNELRQHLTLDKAQVDETARQIAELTPRLVAVREQESDAGQRLQSSEHALEQCRAQWQAVQSQCNQECNRAELLRQRIEHLDERILSNATRLEVLERAGGEERGQALEAERQRADEQLGQVDQTLQQVREQHQQSGRKVEELRASIERLRTQLENTRAARDQAQARQASLQVLNRADEHPADVIEWLKTRQNEPLAPLLERIEVSADEWTAALETVLSGWLQSIRVTQVDELLGHDLPESGLFCCDARDTVSPPGTLASVVSGAGALGAMLGQVRLAPDLASARAQLAGLGPGESVVTRQGCWLGPGWIRQGEREDREAGPLRREQEIRALHKQLQGARRQIDEIEASLSAAREMLVDSEQQYNEHARLIQQTHARRGRAQAELAAIESQLDAYRAQSRQAEDERRQAGQRIDQDRAAVRQARSELEEALAALQQGQADGEPLEKRQHELLEELSRLRLELKEFRDQREALAIRLESSRAGLESLRQSNARMDQQIGQLQGRYLELSEVLAGSDQPEKEQEVRRVELLDQRLAVEQRLAEARSRVEQLETSWRRADEQRRQAAGKAEEIRRQQAEAKLQQRELELKAQGHNERIEALGQDRERLLGAVPEEAELAHYQGELERLEDRIRRLEPVNLAAIEEAEVEAERKSYLDQQHQDLVDALETLEKAIARIDRDTRTRFRETFESINKNLELLFPRLFGGGHGYLELIGDEWLTAGVAILARPPGKRVARIHLLSGGEKALTAVAFVFSIFNLNPAPFCLLDEVDAPLDDANVARFSEMLVEMSETVQFLVVTHNKVTMEVAHQLLGVTMRESGVSRMVSVDLDKAVELATA